MLRNIFTKSLRDQRRSLIFWAIGTMLYVSLNVAIFPSIHNSSKKLDTYVNSWPKVLRQLFMGSNFDLGSGTGFLNARLFSFISPLIFMMFAVSGAARAIAGEEEDGTLDLLLSQPVARRRVVSEKFSALGVGMAVLLVAHFTIMLVADLTMNMGINVLKVFEANISMTLLALAVGAFAFAVGAATGRRAASIAAGSVLGLLAYLINALAPLVHVLKPARRISLFYYYGGVAALRQGITVAGAGVLLAVTAACLAAAFLLFERRDLRN
jgi:ABC-2 type transport system permease protein